MGFGPPSAGGLLPSEAAANQMIPSSSGVPRGRGLANDSFMNDVWSLEGWVSGILLRNYTGLGLVVRFRASKLADMAKPG